MGQVVAWVWIGGDWWVANVADDGSLKIADDGSLKIADEGGGCGVDCFLTVVARFAFDCLVCETKILWVFLFLFWFGCWGKFLI